MTELNTDIQDNFFLQITSEIPEEVISVLMSTPVKEARLPIWHVCFWLAPLPCSMLEEANEGSNACSWTNQNDGHRNIFWTPEKLIGACKYGNLQSVKKNC